MDDCLKSVASQEEAVRMLQRLISALKEELSKWISNSHTVHISIPKERRAKEIKGLDLDQFPIERALG